MLEKTCKEVLDKMNEQIRIAHEVDVELMKEKMIEDKKQLPFYVLVYVVIIILIAILLNMRYGHVLY